MDWESYIDKLGIFGERGDLTQLFAHAGGALVDTAAEVGRAHATRRALEQARPELFFELGNLSSYAGARGAQAPRSCRKATRINYFSE